MRTPLLLASILSLTAALAVGCGSNTPAAPVDGTGGSSAETGGSGGEAGTTESDADVPEGSVADVDPGLDAGLKPYPDGPYGFSKDAVIQNHKWLGWKNPVEATYEEAALEQIELADYYDPDQTKGIKAIFLNASARWCIACKSEQSDIAAQKENWEPKGVVFLETMFEDNAGGPAQFTDLQFWAKAYSVDWTFLLDPTNKLSLYFDKAATPMNMVIDPRTMVIQTVITGAPDAMWYPLQFSSLVNK